MVGDDREGRGIRVMWGYTETRAELVGGVGQGEAGGSRERYISELGGQSKSGHVDIWSLSPSILEGKRVSFHISLAPSTTAHDRPAALPVTLAHYVNNKLLG